MQTSHRNCPRFAKAGVGPGTTPAPLREMETRRPFETRTLKAFIPNGRVTSPRPSDVAFIRGLRRVDRLGDPAGRALPGWRQVARLGPQPAGLRERSDAVAVGVGDEGSRHGQQDLFGMRQADPRAVTEGVGELDLGLTGAAPAASAGDLACPPGAAVRSTETSARCSAETVADFFGAYRDAAVCSVMRRAASAGEMALTSIFTVSSFS